MRKRITVTDETDTGRNQQFRNLEGRPRVVAPAGLVFSMASDRSQPARGIRPHGSLSAESAACTSVVNAARAGVPAHAVIGGNPSSQTTVTAVSTDW